MVLVKNNTYYTFEKEEEAAHQAAHSGYHYIIFLKKEKCVFLSLEKNLRYKFSYVSQIFTSSWEKSFGLLKFILKDCMLGNKDKFKKEKKPQKCFSDKHM